MNASQQAAHRHEQDIEFWRQRASDLAAERDIARATAYEARREQAEALANQRRHLGSLHDEAVADMRRQRDNFKDAYESNFESVKRLGSELAASRETVATLIDAIESVQDWNGTYVGECIDAARAALTEGGAK